MYSLPMHLTHVLILLIPITREVCINLLKPTDWAIITFFKYNCQPRGNISEGERTIDNQSCTSHTYTTITNQSNSIATITMIWTHQGWVGTRRCCRHYRKIPKWRMAEKSSASVGIKPATLHSKFGHNGLWLHLQSDSSVLRSSGFRLVCALVKRLFGRTPWCSRHSSGQSSNLAQSREYPSKQHQPHC